MKRNEFSAKKKQIKYKILTDKIIFDFYFEKKTIFNDLLKKNKVYEKLSKTFPFFAEK